MDRPIHPAERRRKRIKRISMAAGVSVCMLSMLYWGFNYIRPSVKRDRVRVATVARGPVRETISASGTIVPEAEYVIASPISATIREILCQAGDILTPGDSLLILDTNSQVIALETIEEQISLLKHQRTQIDVDLAMRLNDLESQYRQRTLRYEMADAQYRQQQQMFDIGGVSQKDMGETKLALEIAEIDLEQVKKAIENERMLAQNRREQLVREQNIREKERGELIRTIEQARTLIEHGGVLTWIAEETGARVNTGDVIARIADLHSYCAHAAISEIHATKLNPGQPAIVRLGDGTRLEGTVRSIQPTVENGTITFTVALRDANDGHLRSNMRAQIDLVTAETADALRIENGPFAQGYGIGEVFVVEGNRAVRREVEFGVSGFDWLEITGGLAEGDEVIISDMSDRLYARELRLK